MSVPSSLVLANNQGVLVLPPQPQRFPAGSPGDVDRFSRVPNVIFDQFRGLLSRNEFNFIRRTSRHLYNQAVLAVQILAGKQIAMSLFELKDLAKFYGATEHSNCSVLTQQHVKCLTKLSIFDDGSFQSVTAACQVQSLNPSIRDEITSLYFHSNTSPSKEEVRIFLSILPNLKELIFEQANHPLPPHIGIRETKLERITFAQFNEDRILQQPFRNNFLSEFFWCSEENPNITFDLCAEGPTEMVLLGAANYFLLRITQGGRDENPMRSITSYFQRLRHLAFTLKVPNQASNHAAAAHPGPIPPPILFPAKLLDQVQEFTARFPQIILVSDLEYLSQDFTQLKLLNLKKLNLSLIAPNDADLQNIADRFSRMHQLSHVQMHISVCDPENFTFQGLHYLLHKRPHNLTFDCLEKNKFIPLSILQKISKAIDPESTGEDLSNLTPFCPRLNTIVIESLETDLPSLGTLPLQTRNNITRIKVRTALTAEDEKTIKSIFQYAKILKS